MEQDIEKIIQRDTNKIIAYMERSKICNSGYLEVVNNMLKEERTYKEVMNFMAAKGINITPNQISKHKKMLPFITEVQQETPMQAAMQEVREDKIYARQQLNRTELAIETLQKTIQSSQVIAVQDLWGEVIPQMIENIKTQVNNGHRISFKETIDGLDKVVKIAQLLENKPTHIQKSEVNGETQVTHTIESMGDGTAEGVSDMALDAVLQVNNVLQQYAENRGISADDKLN